MVIGNAIGFFWQRTFPVCGSTGLPTGSAKRVPAGSTFVFELHYTPNGSEQQDKTEIGLVFADLDQIDKELITTEIGDLEFVIPPGAASHVVTATSRPTKQEVTLISLSPHMHVRGKSFRYELVLPTGEREVLLDVPAYDFNWQTSYLLAEPANCRSGRSSSAARSSTTPRRTWRIPIPRNRFVGVISRGTK